MLDLDDVWNVALLRRSDQLQSGAPVRPAAFCDQMRVKSENPLLAQCKFGALTNSELLTRTHRGAAPLIKNQWRANVLDRAARRMRA